MSEPLYDRAFLADHLAVTGVEHLRSGTRHDAWRIETGSGSRMLKVFPAEREIRFLRELAVLHNVRHPNLMALDRCGRVNTPQGEVLWYTAEFVDGGDVADAMAARRWPDDREVAAFGAGIAAALVELHRHGIVHCDVKPSNIALRSGSWREPVLLDPGIVRFHGFDTPDRSPVGTTPYMSPEQLRGESAVPASDVFGLGVVLYRLVSRGRHPFVGNGERIPYPEAVERIRRGPLRTLDHGLGSLVTGMLRHAPDDRPSPAELVEFLPA